MILYKVLHDRGSSCNGGNAKWNLPEKRGDGTWKQGEWMEDIVGKIVPCEKGYHLCREQDILSWLDEEIYEAEYDGEIVIAEDKVVVRRCRLTRKCEGWTEKSARLFASWCVRNTPLSDGRCVWDILTDKRSKNAVEVAERYARRDATGEELVAARDAAWAAARAAAQAAARDAARATRDAAQAAAWAAARATRDAAWAAARAAQTREIIKMLENEEGIE